MKKSVRTGLNFGLTSGTITTLGLMIGLYSGTSSKMVVIGGILIIAIADALSDSLGIHIAEESKTKSKKHIWSATLSAFISKFLYTLTFIIPILIFNLQLAIIVSTIYGLIVLTFLSLYIAKKQKTSPIKATVEHLIIAIIVIIITYYLGKLISIIFV